MTESGNAWVHAHRCAVPAEPGRVFAALTEPSELRQWFAEHVDVEARDGGKFRFWGRHTYGVPDAVAATQAITRLEPGRALAFRWTVDGLPTEVTIELEPDAAKPSQTQLNLRHAFPGRLPVDYALELVDDLWRLTLGNLDAHLRGGQGIVLPDFTDPSPEIRISLVIDAPRDLVFRALIDPAALNTWVASSAEVEPRVGGRYRYGWRYPVGGRDVDGGPTTILDLVENERLVTDWLDWRGDDTRSPTRVAWLLEDVGEKTRVTVVHGGFSRAADASDYPFGWAEFLGRLKSVTESPR
jgi:uncharacterized protein YndB with AHSA1/START domain